MNPQSPESRGSTAKIVRDRGQLRARLADCPHPVVFTNGCFDILHRGHVAYLEEAAALGHTLVVGVNSDESSRRLGKHPARPVNPLDDRMAVLAGLGCTDVVVPFSEDTPLALILAVRPDVLVKGGDWALETIVGREQVESWGGTVRAIPIQFARSTTDLIERIRS